MFLKTRIEKLEQKLNPETVNIKVSHSEGHCPSDAERARIRAANPDKAFIYVCHCPNCCPEDF